MKEQARKELCDLIAEQGIGFCQLTTMAEISLKKQEAAHPQETQALIAILRLGVTAKLKTASMDERAAIAEQASKANQLSLELAQWAVDSWVNALERVVPPSTPAWQSVPDSRPHPEGSSYLHRSIVHLLVVTLAGAGGAAMPGIQIGTAIHHDLTGQISAITSNWLGGENGLEFALLYGSLGLVAGAVGAGVGWMVGGGQSETYMISGGTTLGRLGGAMVGAFLLARFGALVGLLLGGTAGVFFGGLIGGTVGAFLGYIIGAFIFLFLLLCIFF
ncbi:MAG: hypothetical protein HY040_05720 [Planctomycetes bacterium]|nr:hypothetical protein [Planctomycetota bacterium]